MKIAKWTVLLLTTMLALSACEEKGPMEKAGAKMDEMVKDAGNAIEDACEDAKEAAGAKDDDC